ncbi:MAG: energy transducer TonB [Gammaproteobacteria bacterium]|nr:energy transducer TonB [Gammaproteobacteria bacterium]
MAKKTHPLTAPAAGQPPAQNAIAKAGMHTAMETQDVRQRLEVEIQQALVHHFSYPLLARKRGWQGEVVLAFRLESDGRILDARIASSSGHGVLDRAALKSLTKVERLEHETAHSFTLQIPVIYRLEG